MKKHLACLLLALSCIASNLSTFADDIPKRPEPARLVNDGPGMLSPDEAAALEQRLMAFYDSTTMQVVIVIMKDIEMEISDMAFGIGNTWGVGQQKLDNGVVLLWNYSEDTKRRGTFIATGYGMEGYLPDVLCSRICRDTIGPYFREGQYFQGLNAGVDAIFKNLVMSPEDIATRDELLRQQEAKELWTMIIIVIILIVIIAVLIFFFGGGGDSSLTWSWSSGGGSSGGSSFGFGGGGFGGGGGGGGY